MRQTSNPYASLNFFPKAFILWHTHHYQTLHPPRSLKERKSHVEITQNALIITLPAEDPAHKLADLRSGLLFVLNDFFSHLDNTVDVDSGAAYNDLIWLLKAMLPTGEAIAGIEKNRRAC